MNDSMTSEREALLGDPPAPASPPPPPRRQDSGLRKTAPLIVASVILAMMLFVVVISIDEPDTAVATNDDDPFANVETLTVPQPLDVDAMDENGGLVPDSFEPSLPEGGWIQTTNEQGQLAQQYRADSLDPNPDGARTGSVSMRGLEAQLYADNGRVTVMTGDQALVYAPNNVLNDGTITGNVVIRIFEPINGAVDLEAHEPEVEIRTSSASFDNFSGEINCDGVIDVQTAQAHFRGEQLFVTINEAQGRIEYLRIDTVQFIRLIADEMTQTAAHRPAPHRAAQSTIVPVTSRPRMHSIVQNEPLQFYVATLDVRVRIQQGAPEVWREATGDQMRLVFSFDDSDDADSTADPEVAAARPTGPLNLREALAYSSIGSLQDRTDGLFQPTSPDDVITVTCDGPLVMVPATRDTDRLAGADHMRLDLAGAPVTLRDDMEALDTTCGSVSIEGPQERLTLRASDEFPVTVASPDLDAHGELFFFDRTAATAGFAGPGWMLPRDPDRTSARDEATSGLRIAWTHQADFDLVNTDDRERMSIRHAHLDGAVDIESDRGRIVCNTLDLALTVNDAGDTIPQMMLAIGAVQAQDDRVSIRAEELEVAFDAADGAPRDEDSTPVFGGTSRVRAMTAREDVRLVLADGSRTFSDELFGETTEETIRLSGEQVFIVTDRMLMRCQHRLDVHRQNGIVWTDWPGTAHVFDTPIALPAGAEPVAVIDQLFDTESHPTDLAVRWTDGMTVTFTEPEDEDGDPIITGVYFRGNVDIEAPEGRMNGDEVDLALAAGPDGSAQPTRLHVVGRVAAHDADLSLWTDDLLVTFRPDVATDDSTETTPADREPIFGADTDIDTFTADGRVQVLLENGSRVFADRLVGSAPQQRVDLFGEDITIVSDRLLLQRGTRYELRKSDGVMRGFGVGEARIFASSIIDNVRDRIDPPTIDDIDADPDVVTTWTESMRFDNTFNNGAGALDLVGDVRSESR
ncbi:MAG: hypothetical protein AAF432_16230, partial [Planctomycetota bacterium]